MERKTLLIWNRVETTFNSKLSYSQRGSLIQLIYLSNLSIRLNIVHPSNYTLGLLQKGHIQSIHWSTHLLQNKPIQPFLVRPWRNFSWQRQVSLHETWKHQHYVIHRMFGNSAQPQWLVFSSHWESVKSQIFEKRPRYRMIHKNLVHHRAEWVADQPQEMGASKHGQMSSYMGPGVV